VRGGGSFGFPRGLTAFGMSLSPSADWKFESACLTFLSLPILTFFPTRIFSGGGSLLSLLIFLDGMLLKVFLFLLIFFSDHPSSRRFESFPTFRTDFCAQLFFCTGPTFFWRFFYSLNKTPPPFLSGTRLAHTNGTTPALPRPWATQRQSRSFFFFPVALFFFFSAHGSSLCWSLFYFQNFCRARSLRVESAYCHALSVPIMRRSGSPLILFPFFFTIVPALQYVVCMPSREFV